MPTIVPAQNTTWQGWITSSSSTSTVYYQNQVWDDWINTTCTTSSNFTLLPQQVWATWQTAPHLQYEYVYGAPRVTPRVVETPEELTARLDREQAAREEASRRRLAEQVRMEGAQERAMELLLMILTPEERLWHDQHDEIMVRGESGRLYVIEKRGVHGNIRQTDEHGCLLGRVCVAPEMYDHDAQLYLPLADGWVGQYLAIKHNEEALRTTGNWSSLGRCTQPNVPVLGQRAA